MLPGKQMDRSSVFGQGQRGRCRGHSSGSSGLGSLDTRGSHHGEGGCLCRTLGSRWQLCCWESRVTFTPHLPGTPTPKMGSWPKEWKTLRSEGATVPRSTSGSALTGFTSPLCGGGRGESLPGVASGEHPEPRVPEGGRGSCWRLGPVRRGPGAHGAGHMASSALLTPLSLPLHHSSLGSSSGAE